MRLLQKRQEKRTVDVGPEDREATPTITKRSVTSYRVVVRPVPQRSPVISSWSWLWPTIVVVSTFIVGLVTSVFPATPLRPAVVMWFLFVCPGMVLVRFLRLKQLALEWTLALALSFAVDSIVAGMLLYAGRWSPMGILGALMGLCLTGAVVQLVMLAGWWRFLVKTPEKDTLKK